MPNAGTIRLPRSPGGFVLGDGSWSDCRLFGLSPVPWMKQVQNPRRGLYPDHFFSLFEMITRQSASDVQSVQLANAEAA